MRDFFVYALPALAAALCVTALILLGTGSALAHSTWG